ncbi:MAG: ABC transporter permease, partial [Anaerolineae bacterium]
MRSPRWLRDVFPPVLLIGFLILIWHLAATQGGLSDFVLPSPAGVLQAAWETRERLWSAVGITMLETVLGLSISIVLGIALAAAMDLSSFLRRALYPLLVASQTVQILAIAPLLIIWFGFGLLPKVLIVVLVCFFP